MTVWELICALQKMPMDAEVVISGDLTQLRRIESEEHGEIVGLYDTTRREIGYEGLEGKDDLFVEK
jgi:hypothetical protein